MSRHRIIRSMDFSEEYEGYDDVYGHSVDDDNCISPTDAQQWIYNRSKGQHLMSSFLQNSLVNDGISRKNNSNTGDNNKAKNNKNIKNIKNFIKINESDIDIDSIEKDTDGKVVYQYRENLEANYKIPILNEAEQEQLFACIEGVRDVVGDTISEQSIAEAAIQFGYDIEKVLDDILNKGCAGKLPMQSKDKSISLTSSSSTSTSTTSVIAGAKKDPNLSNDYSSQLATNEVNEKKISKEGVSGNVWVTTASQRDIKRGFEVNGPASPSLPIKNDCSLVSSGGDDSVTINKTPSTASDNPINNTQFKVSKEQSKRDIQKMYNAERSNKKQHLNMIVIGHVDAGKSTLMGHLLYDTGNVSQRLMHKYEQESKKIGKQSFMYAWVLDETSEERARGITMDIANFQFSTDTKTITIIDAPGHKDFIPNMILGATQADVALLIIDATRGEFESGFESGGQTREHALLVRSLGIQQLGVIINKMDTVSWSQERFDDIVKKLRIFLKQAGYKENDVTYVPCSGLNGENLTRSATSANLLSWYQGPHVLAVIDNFRVPNRSIDKPFRMSVSDIYKNTGSGYFISGRIETGMLALNDKILMGCNREQGNIKVINIDDMPQNCAFAGDQVSIIQVGIDVNNIAVGNVIYDPKYPIPITNWFQARILVFNIKVPITKGFPVIMHHQSSTEPATISKLCAQINKSTGENMKMKPRCLGSNSCALVEIRTSRPICIERYIDYKEMGRFMLRVAGTTIAAGMVCHIYDEK